MNAAASAQAFLAEAALDRLSVDELNALVGQATTTTTASDDSASRTSPAADPVALDVFFHKQRIPAQLQASLRDLKRSNDAAAVANLAHEDEVQQQRRQLDKAQTDFVQTQRTTQQLFQRHAAALKAVSADACVQRVAAAARQADADSERLAEAYLAAGQTLREEDFVRQFRDLRRLFHARTAKVESSRSG